MNPTSQKAKELADRLENFNMEDIECSVRLLTDLQLLMGKAAEALRELSNGPDEPVSAQQEVWRNVRILAEGSDWKRDDGESLAEWIWRAYRALKNAAPQVLMPEGSQPADKNIPPANPNGGIYREAASSEGRRYVDPSAEQVLCDGPAAAVSEAGAERGPTDEEVRLAKTAMLIRPSVAAELAAVVLRLAQQHER